MSVTQSLRSSEDHTAITKTTSPDDTCRLPIGSEDLRPLLEPYLHLTEKAGNELRPALIQAFNAWLQIPQKHLTKIGEIVQLLHNSSLLIDDIEDNCKLRRSRPASHRIFGIPATLNCGNLLFCLVLKQLQDLGKPESYAIFAEELTSLHRGQGFDIHWRDSHLCPTEEQYKQMVIDKTGGLFRLAVRLMGLFSERKVDLIPLVDELSLYYQIRNDYLDLLEESTAKVHCEDLTEGKYSFPIIHAIRKKPDDTRLQRILMQHTEDDAIKSMAVEYIRSQGSFDYTKLAMEKHLERALALIRNLGGNEPLSRMLLALHRSI